MRFVHDGEDGTCLANVQRVSLPLPDAVAEPARGTDIARAATVVADGWAQAFPMPAKAADGPAGCCDISPGGAQLARQNRGGPSRVV